MDSLSFLLAQNVKITNWLTPVWMFSVGISIGFLLVVVMMLKFWIVSKIPGLNSIGDDPKKRTVVGFFFGLIYLAAACFAYWWFYRPTGFDQSMVMPLVFAIPMCMLLGIGIWMLCSKNKFTEVWNLFNEGFLMWINLICYTAIAIAVLGFVLAPFNGFGLFKMCDDPMGFMNSLGRFPYAGEYSTDDLVIPPAAEGDTGQEVAIDFYGQETTWIQFKSDQKLEACMVPITSRVPPPMIFYVPSSENAVPFRTYRRGNTLLKIPDGKNEKLFILNLGDEPASVKVSWLMLPVYAQVWIIPLVAAVVVGLYLFYMLLAMMFPKVSAIAMSTFKTEISQPLFTIVMLIGLVFILGSIYLPYNTFGEDIKMYKDSGLTLIRVLGIFLAIWAASKSVAEEIEGRTALTVLSKPVGRRQFILGKFSGISLAVALMFIVLGLWFVIWTGYKPIYDGKESSLGLIEWETSFIESIHIIPGLFLCFLEVTIFVAISIAISTRMGILANFLICFSIYVLGHLTPLIAQSNFAAFEPVVVFSKLIAIVFPVLDHFDVQAAINTNRPVPMVYLGWSIIYTTLYGAIAMLLALVLFEDRDLA